MSLPKGGNHMKPTDGPGVKKTFLDIPNAAELAGFSVRHFRRIIEEERIRIVQIGRKFFILGSDFERWQAAKKARPS
jgi:excisionase family DNA binding protein